MLYLIDPRKSTGHYGVYPAPVASAIVSVLRSAQRAYSNRTPLVWAFIDTASKADTFEHAYRYDR